MIEIPESRVLSQQVSEILVGKKITKVLNASSHHKFTFYSGDPEKYSHILVGKQIIGSRGHGMFVDVIFEENTYISVLDGTNMRYFSNEEKYPEKYQLLIIFEDETSLVFTVAMYGGIMAYQNFLDNKYHIGSLNSVSPLSESFNENYFDNIFKNQRKNISIKALLATEQRIPGLGNGVLQDILFSASIHPRRKMLSITDFEKGELFYSLKQTLNLMSENGGRDTEKDLFGKQGGYKTLLSKNTYKKPCPICGSAIVKEAYLGGSVYFCPVCQK